MHANNDVCTSGFPPFHTGGYVWSWNRQEWRTYQLPWRGSSTSDYGESRSTRDVCVKNSLETEVAGWSRTTAVELQDQDVEISLSRDQETSSAWYHVVVEMNSSICECWVRCRELLYPVLSVEQFSVFQSWVSDRSHVCQNSDVNFNDVAWMLLKD